MPLPDPKKDEPVVELDKNLFREYLQAKTNADAWVQIAMNLKRQILDSIGPAHAATVEGVKVLTYRPSKKYVEAELRKQYPDLVQHFMRPETTTVFDMEAFVMRHPDIAEQFRVRSLREVGE